MTQKGSPMSPEWIAVDWGTSNLRAWAMGPDGPMAEASSAEGMGTLTKDQFEPALLRLISPWLSRKTQVIACGMVGSRQGWFEAPYRTTPCIPVAYATHTQIPTLDPRLDMRVTPGLKQIHPADVMRGEETQIAGALALMPDFDGVFCLPGTHSKWVHISAGEVVSFQTFMTGEMFALLSNQSVLRHSVTSNHWDATAFAAGVAAAMERPERLSARLFTLRAESLIANLPPAAARARLSGLLIGVELAAAKPYWLGQRVALIGSAKLSTTYAAALAAQGVTAQQLDATACTLASLATARGVLQKADL